MIQKTCGWEHAYRMIVEKNGRDKAEKLFDKASKLFDKYQERYNQETGIGDMKNGVIFERKGTLGRGDECCDFCFRIP